MHGQAARFDGVDDYISVLDHNTLDLTTTGTLAAWVKLETGTSQYNSVINKSVGSSGNQVSYELMIGNDGLGGANAITGYAHDGSINTLATSLTDIVDVTWHHLAFTWDGAVGNMYLDGQLDNDQTSAGTGATIEPYNLYLGRHWQTSHSQYYYLKGFLDDVAIYDRELSASEVQQLAQPVPEPTTIALLGIGLAGLAGTALRRRLKKAKQ